MKAPADRVVPVRPLRYAAPLAGVPHQCSATRLREQETWKDRVLLVADTGGVSLLLLFVVAALPTAAVLVMLGVLRRPARSSR